MLVEAVISVDADPFLVFSDLTCHFVDTPSYKSKPILTDV